MTTRVISASGADVSLFAIASREYGDWRKWDVLAEANGLIDPFITGIGQLIVPDASGAGTDGIPPQP